MDWPVLLSTFGLVFLAELGDKTQLAVMVQTCKYRRPWAVFWGASLALTGVTALGVVGGQLLGRFIPLSALRVIAALAFVGMGLLVAREAAQANPAPEDRCALPEDVEGEDCPSPGWDWRPFLATLGLLFVAELGDKTQLAVLVIAGQEASPWPVFLGGSLALTGVTALGVIGGQALCRRIPERFLLWGSAVAFILIGLLMGGGVL